MECTGRNVYSSLTRARQAIRRKLEEDDPSVGQPLVVKGLVLLPLAALFLAEESTYMAAVLPVTAVSAAAATATTTTATTTATATTVVGYVAAACVAVACVGAIAVSSYFVLRDTSEPTPLPTTPPHTAITTEYNPTPTAIPTPTPTPAPTTPAPTTPEPSPETTPMPTLPPALPPPIPTFPPEAPAQTEPVVYDRTDMILFALYLAQTQADTVRIITDYGFVFATQMVTSTDRTLRFYTLNEGSGDILIGTAIDEDGTQWRMRFNFFENAHAPQDRIALYDWMRE